MQAGLLKESKDKPFKTKAEKNDYGRATVKPNLGMENFKNFI